MAVRPNPFSPVSFDPLGTKDEVLAAGLSLDEVGTCAPQDMSNGVRGCEEYPRCPFHLKRYGAFKGKGPKNVGVHIRDLDDGVAQLECSCHQYCRALLRREINGNMQRMQGKRGELIRVVAQEGETIKERVTLPVTPGSKTDMRMKQTIVDRKVSAHPRPSQLKDLTYEAEMFDVEQRLLGAEEGALDLVVPDEGEKILDPEEVVAKATRAALEGSANKK